MNTYQFCAARAAKEANRIGRLRVLDYGCGAGNIVGLLRRLGLTAFGCDVFYRGGDSSGDLDPDAAPFISRMEGDRIPFEDESFGVVLSNQVMEHVPNLETVLREIVRVMKPGGVALNLFPDRGIWREGHCGIPFQHWFRKGSQSRLYYTALARGIGLGRYKGDKPMMVWTRESCAWLDAWTYYRPLAEIHASFAKYFMATRHAEEEWFDARLEGRARAVPTPLKRFIVRKFAGMVLISTKASDPNGSGLDDRRPPAAD